MGLTQETLCPVISELTFIRKQKTEESNGLVLYFQSPEFLAEYGLELPVEDLLSNLSAEDFKQFKGNIKFILSAEQLYIPVNQQLISCQPNKKYVVKFGFSPEVFNTGSGSVKYVKTRPISIYESWTEYFKALKVSGAIHSHNPTATAN